MFFSKTKAAQVPLQQQTNLQLLATLTSELSAIKANTAFISFTPDGKVLDANKNFLDIVGYSLTELVGQHHQLLCEATVCGVGGISAVLAKISQWYSGQWHVFTF